MFNHNGEVFDKKADLLFVMADEEGRGEASEGQKCGKVHSHHACLGLDEDEWMSVVVQVINLPLVHCILVYPYMASPYTTTQYGNRCAK